MAFPAIISTTTYTGPAVDATSWNVFSGFSTSSGDFLLLFLTADGAPIISTPAGWTLFSPVSGQGSTTFHIYYKISSGGSESLTITSSAAEKYAAIVYRIAGADTITGTLINLDSLPGHNVGTSKDHLWLGVASNNYGVSFYNAAPADNNGIDVFEGFVQCLGSTTSHDSASLASSHLFKTAAALDAARYYYTKTFASGSPYYHTFALSGPGAAPPTPTPTRIQSRTSLWL